MFADAGAHGFLGMEVPEEYGGGGVDDFRYNLVIVRGGPAGRHVGGAGLGITLHNDICLPYFLALLHRRAARRAGCPASRRAS